MNIIKSIESHFVIGKFKKDFDDIKESEEWKALVAKFPLVEHVFENLCKQVEGLNYEELKHDLEALVERIKHEVAS